MADRLKGKAAVVTGGGTGIGAAVALALAGEGCRVVIAGRRNDKLRETAARFEGKPDILCHAADVAEPGSITSLFHWALEKLGRIDILVNSAGVNVIKRTLVDLSDEDWDKMLAINVTGVFHCMRAALSAMREQQDGLIVNINSISGKRAGLLGGVGYNASKFALTALGVTAAVEERKNGIRVTNVFPGEVDTPILENRPVPVTAEHRAKILQASDVADAVLMIACLPARAHVAELTIKPTSQDFV